MEQTTECARAPPAGRGARFGAAARAARAGYYIVRTGVRAVRRRIASSMPWNSTNAHVTLGASAEGLRADSKVLLVVM